MSKNTARQEIFPGQSEKKSLCQT